MIELNKVLVIPIIINIIIAIADGVYHKYKLDKSGIVIASYRHDVFDKEEVIIYSLAVLILSLIAGYYQPDLILLILLAVVAGGIAKYKMGQSITLTDQGILIKGKFELWKNILKIELVDDVNIDIMLHKRGYEIVNLENPEDFIRISKGYYRKIW